MSDPLQAEFNSEQLMKSDYHNHSVVSAELLGLKAMTISMAVAHIALLEVRVGVLSGFVSVVQSYYSDIIDGYKRLGRLS